MKFVKMHGTGNDYVYVNCFTEKVEKPEEPVRFISDRHKGIGSDGLVLILPSDGCDFRMRMFNPDGSEAEMCGNASRYLLINSDPALRESSVTNTILKRITG